jgi:hypothetical protein
VTAQQLLRIQAGYYFASGLFPLVSMSAFERITGPKVDKWLVQMVGALAASIGLSLAVGSRRKAVDESIVLLSIASALSFAGIDVVHTARRRISPIYLSDAVIEAVIVFSLVRCIK